MKSLKEYIKESLSGIQSGVSLSEKLVINKNSKFEADQLLDRLTDEEIDILTKYFEDNVKNIEEINTKNGKFSICFDKRLKTRQGDKVRLVITKPPRSAGGYNICLYKNGIWLAQNIGGKNKKKNGNPLFENINEVIECLNKNFLNGRWAAALGANLKK